MFGKEKHGVRLQGEAREVSQMAGSAQSPQGACHSAQGIAGGKEISLADAIFELACAIREHNAIISQEDGSPQEPALDLSGRPISL